MRSFILIMFLILASYGVRSEDILQLDQRDSYVGFEIIKFKIGAPVKGEFKVYSGKASFDSGTEKIKNLVVKVKVASIDTNNEKRNKHLLTDENFFNQSKYPFITYRIKSAQKLQKGSKLVGNITIKGITKQIVLKIDEYTQTSDGISFKSSGVINRLDFKVSWNMPLEKSAWKKIFGKLGKFVLDDEVKISFFSKFSK